MRNFKPLLFLLISIKLLTCVCASPERSFFEFDFNRDDNELSIPITLSKETSVIVTILCESINNTEVTIKYTLTERICHNLDENKTLDDPTIYESEKHTCNGVINLKKIHISPNNKIFEVGEPASDNTLLSASKRMEFTISIQLLVDSHA
ncbi:hypothetical protein PVAND_014726 [Polypedilum vanderplanki]|uniref:Uncharacterized protein n=1 Tax=Polypedilum vanderplanki TaxID=319348 RepID=A0A9J6BAJ8_POLVA|nr:hypothetical protein PVAND_014726 [Polypedilum vanderplanki]